MPLGDLQEDARRKVLVVGAAKVFVEQLSVCLGGVVVALARSGFDAGAVLDTFQPDTVVVDMALGRSEGLQIARSLRGDSRFDEVALVALVNEDELEMAGMHVAFGEVFQKPFDAADLADCIRRGR